MSQQKSAASDTSPKRPKPQKTNPSGGTEKGASSPPEGKPLRIKAKDDGLIIYSVGPNGIDDGAEFEYEYIYEDELDEVLEGDVTLYLSFDREYPFPAKPKKYLSTEEILQQFPNGLPRDSFHVAGWWNQNEQGEDLLHYYENGSPVLLSRGPDRNISKVDKKYYRGEKPNAIRVDANDGTFSIQELDYDPTNGTVSDGNIFLRFD